jgi:DnaJ-class molecular chaperone
MDLDRINKTKQITCPTCKGLGTSKEPDPDANLPLACGRCDGSGQISVPVEHGLDLTV